MLKIIIKQNQKFNTKRDIFFNSNFEKFYEFRKKNDEKILIFGCINYTYYNKKINSFSYSKKNIQTINSLIKNLRLQEIRNFFVGKYILLTLKGDKVSNAFLDQCAEKQIFYSRYKNKVMLSDNLGVFNKDNYKNFNQIALAGIIGNFGNYSFQKTTIYDHIKKIGVNEILSFKKSGLKTTKFNYKLKNIQYDLQEKDFDNFFEITCEAIKSRISNQTNWVYLSSGYDSSFILGMLNYLVGPKKIRAVIGKLKYSNRVGVCNNFEIKRTRKIADYYKVPLDIINIDYTNDKFLSEYEENKKILRKNHNYAIYANNFLELAKFAKQNSKIGSTIFNGDISDGVQNFGFSQFATLLSFEDLNFREYADKMMCYLYSPNFFKKISKGSYSQDLIFNFLKTQKSISTSSKKSIDFKFKYLATLFLSPFRFPFTGIIDKNLITKEKQSFFERYLFQNYFKDIVNKVSEKNLYSAYIELYKSFHWSGGTVRGITNASECYDLRSSTPFWDSTIQDFYKKMPPRYGRDLSINQTKYATKWILKNKIDYPSHLQVGPHSYNYDVDPSWSADVDILYDSNLTNKFKKQLKERKYREVIDNSFINLRYLDKLSSEYIASKKLSGKKLADLKGLISLVDIGWF